MNLYTQFSTSILALTFSAALLFAGCNNPASNDDEHEEHSETHSMEFVMNGETIVTYANGNVNGHFDVKEQDETALITVEFFDEEGNEIHGDDLDEEFSLGWNIANTDYAEIVHHDEDGRWSFHIKGKQAGETTVQFMLMHGDHSDFETPSVDQSNAIEIHVSESSQ
jgi:hypothetical protein